MCRVAGAGDRTFPRSVARPSDGVTRVETPCGVSPSLLLSPRRFDGRVDREGETPQKLGHLSALDAGARPSKTVRWHLSPTFGRPLRLLFFAAMRVSEHYRLGLTQPRALGFRRRRHAGRHPAVRRPTGIANEHRPLGSRVPSTCPRFLRSGDRVDPRRARGGRPNRLLAGLSEPNETRLGLSRGRAQGRGVGRDLAQELRSMLEASEAVRTGMLEDLEDSILLVRGIGYDIVSDITTNVIREPLIRYTEPRMRAA